MTPRETRISAEAISAAATSEAPSPQSGQPLWVMRILDMQLTKADFAWQGALANALRAEGSRTGAAVGGFISFPAIVA
jgi:hypothetical protein